MAEERNFRKVRRGYVVSDKMDKTISSSSSSVRPTRFTARLCVPPRTVKVHDEHKRGPHWRPREYYETRP